MKSLLKYFFVVVLIVGIDQGSKLWIHYHLPYGIGASIPLLGNFFKLTYVLNYGVAFGLQLGFKYGKMFITCLRIVISIAICIQIVRDYKNAVSPFWIWGWVLVLSGAIGNSIDSIFYGVYLNNAPSIAPLKWFHGQVIDMIHVNIWSGVLPVWVPIWGGQEVCCLPIFNIADVAIFLGVLMVFYTLKSKQADQQNNQCTEIL